MNRLIRAIVGLLIGFVLASLVTFATIVGVVVRVPDGAGSFRVIGLTLATRVILPDGTIQLRPSRFTLFIGGLICVIAVVAAVRSKRASAPTASE